MPTLTPNAERALRAILATPGTNLPIGLANSFQTLSAAGYAYRCIGDDFRSYYYPTPSAAGYVWANLIGR